VVGRRRAGARGRTVRRYGNGCVLAVVVAVVAQIGQVARPADAGSTAKNSVDELLVAWVAISLIPAVLSARHPDVFPTAFNEGHEANG